MIKLTLYKKGHSNTLTSMFLYGNPNGYLYYKERIFKQMNNYFTVILSSSLVNDILNQAVDFNKGDKTFSGEIELPLYKDEYLVYFFQKY